jgi:thiol-disulfide isomerase/thioredoxin/acetone carboxylase gamma subunit
MKTLPIVVLLFTASFVFAQNGKIEMKNPDSGPECKATFIYEPPPGLNLPEGIQVNSYCSDFKIKLFPLEKKGAGYEFTMKLPPKSTVLFFAVSDSKQHILDNNSGEGYVVYLKDPSEEGFELTLYEKIQHSMRAGSFLDLDYTEQDILEQYETLLDIYPNLKNESVYASYLIDKFFINKVETRPKLIDFAEKMTGKDDEKSLSAAYTIYFILEMDAERKQVGRVAMEKYPRGNVAKNYFVKEYYSVRERNETYMLTKIDEFIELFSDPSDPELERIYEELILLYLEKMDTLSIAKYKDLITNKINLAFIYYDYAREASGKDLTSPGKDLDFAEQISLKSLDLVEYLMEHPEEEKEGYDLQKVHHYCADTYALILYKQKKYDLAFQYQQKIVEAVGDDMYTSAKERYAVFAEEAKGKEFAKDYLEKQLLAGIDSKIMMEHLQEIYSKLDLPENEFENIKKQYKESAVQKDREEIMEKFGDIKATDFTLVNLEGENVSLSDYKGTLVLLDFWATWCGPCKSSFPKMQELVTQFQNDNVEFFFINTWERQAPEKVREEVAEFLKEKGYSFNVLFDYTDEVANKYKVQGIPKRILIDKSGNMRAIVRSTDDLAGMIYESL